MVNVANHDQNPTAEFNEYCSEIIRRWEAGELPFKEAVALITTKGQEAVAANHLANQGRAEHLLGYLQHFRGEISASIRHYERAHQLFQQVGNTHRMAVMDLNNGENYRLKGDFVRARWLYRAAYDLGRELESIRIQAIAALNEGLALLTMGQMEAAFKSLQEAKGLIDKADDNPSNINGMLCELHHGLTCIYLHEHNIEEAWNTAQLALAHAQRTTHKMQLGLAYRDIGEVLTQMSFVPEGYTGDCDDYFRLSQEIFRELHMEAEIARTIFGQAKSLAYRGRKTTAARKLQQAMIMFTQLGMVDDVAKAAEAQLSVL